MCYAATPSDFHWLPDIGFLFTAITTIFSKRKKFEIETLHTRWHKVVHNEGDYIMNLKKEVKIYLFEFDVEKRHNFPVPLII